MHIKLDFYVLIDLGLHHVLFSSGAPELHPRCGNEYREWFLCEYLSICCLQSISELHNKGEFLEWAIEFGIHKLFVARYLLPHAVPFYDDVFLSAIDPLCDYSVNAACPRKPFRMLREPLLVQPMVLREKAVCKGEAWFGDIQISLITQVKMGIRYAKNADFFCFGMHDSSRWHTTTGITGGDGA